MQLPQLLRDDSLRQQEFPVTRRSVYLAHAGVCPLPRRVESAIAHYASRCLDGDQEEAVTSSFLAETRALAARLLRCEPGEVAFVGPTSLALSFVANGLRFQPGDNVLAYFDDYPSNVYPWMALAGQGVEVRWLQAPALGRIEPDDVLRQVDDRTRLVALASAHFVAGWRLDYATLGRALRDRGIWFCLDAIQTLGAFPMDATQVDFLAADAHKWLLGPCAAGLLYVRKAVQEQLRPAALGWHNVRCPGYVAQTDLVLKPDARRYEPGSANLLGLAGLRAALELVLEVGVEAIAAELLRKRAWLVPALRDRGYTVLHAEAQPANGSGIVSCYLPGTDMAARHRRLADSGIVTSLRNDREGRSYLRLSPHFYNTDAELERALLALEG